MKAVRSAEKDRTSSCGFADEIARLSATKFEECCPTALRASYKQTVLAAILIHSTKRGLQVASLGVGTKVLSIDRIVKDKTPSGASELVRDCHAEVLAKRAFVRYLYDIISFFGHDDDVTKRYREDDDVPFRLDKNSGLLVLRAGHSIHLYTSSQPCGNASIKLWAKGKKPKVYDASELPDGQPYPLGIHAQLHVTARAQGQVSLLVKRNGVGAGVSISSSNAEDVEKATASTDHAGTDPADTRVAPPAGTAYPLCGPVSVELLESVPGCVMTCSDKIAKWNALGLQVVVNKHILPIIWAIVSFYQKSF
jgi:double-stranded RNA-specific adenosine deaminase